MKWDDAAPGSIILTTRVVDAEILIWVSRLWTKQAAAGDGGRAIWQIIMVAALAYQVEKYFVANRHRYNVTGNYGGGGRDCAWYGGGEHTNRWHDDREGSVIEHSEQLQGVQQERNQW